MDGSTREIQRLQLRSLLLTDPRGLLELYCRAVGTSISSQLPRDISFRMMIEAILDHEEKMANHAHQLQPRRIE